MKPGTDRFRLVEALRVGALLATSVGGRVQVVDATETGRIRTLIRVGPRTARTIADELERRWTS